jgi:hypothetical protein
MKTEKITREKVIDQRFNNVVKYVERKIKENIIDCGGSYTYINIPDDLYKEISEYFPEFHIKREIVPEYDMDGWQTSDFSYIYKLSI